MVDINPAETISKYTPRATTIVDAVAETKRIADQQMRSNPLKNARIDSGLTRWVGNYDGDLVWIGEFLPYDANLTDAYGNPKPQRGVSIVRDDPQHSSAFVMYDWNPQPGVPLRQKIAMHDADGRRLLVEGDFGGRNYPDKAIPMYPRISIDSGGNATSAELVWSGEGNIIGTHMHFAGTWAASGSPTVSNFVRYSGGGITINTPTITSNPNHRTDITSIYQVSDYVNVEWYVWRSAGTGLYYPRPYLCRNWSQ